jgi:hypothetical protein
VVSARPFGYPQSSWNQSWNFEPFLAKYEFIASDFVELATDRDGSLPEIIHLEISVKKCKNYNHLQSLLVPALDILFTSMSARGLESTN